MKALRLLWTLNALMASLAAACMLQAATNGDNSHNVSTTAAVKDAPIEREYYAASVELQWFDYGRARQVPVKIYYPSADKGPFPVVLFSHGLGRSREDCAYLGMHWASRGYVSVFVEHAGSDEAVWRGKVQPKKHLKEAYENPATLRNRPLDMLFALDQLDSLKRQGDSLALRFDLERIGAAGCDMGAETVLALAGQILPNGMIFSDRRIRAVVAMSPPVPQGQVPLDAAYKDINVPCLYLTGSRDDGIVGETKAYQRRIPFDNSSEADQYLAVFFGGDHMIYSGHLKQRKSEKDARFQPLIRDASTLFWDGYLGEKSGSLVTLRGMGLDTVMGSRASVEKKLTTDANASTVSHAH
jgi:predicted dienelactone hydrolase